MKKIINQFVLWVAIFAMASLCHAQDETYITKVYTDNGGDRLNVKSGGTLTVFSGGDFDLKSGAKLLIAGSDTTKVAAFTDNTRTKLDSGALTITSGSQTVTTSLTACDRVFTTIAVDNAGSATTFKTSTSGAGFTIYGYDPVTGATRTTNFTGYWLAIDE